MDFLDTTCFSTACRSFENLCVQAVNHLIPQTSYIRHQKGRVPFGESGLFLWHTDYTDYTDFFFALRAQKGGHTEPTNEREERLSSLRLSRARRRKAKPKHRKHRKFSPAAREKSNYGENFCEVFSVYQK